MNLTEIIATSPANVHMSFFLLKIANCHQRTHTDNTVMVLRPQMIPQHVVPLLTTMKAKKITTTTQSTTVAELNALMKCFGTCLFLRALWADVSGEIVPTQMLTTW